VDRCSFNESNLAAWDKNNCGGTKSRIKVDLKGERQLKTQKRTWWTVLTNSEAGWGQGGKKRKKQKANCNPEGEPINVEEKNLC